ncbi:MAG: cytochrome c biogenesis protein CcdA [Deinococcota bacterium]
MLEMFLLGNAAILSNVCILPLYPGLIAFLAGNASTVSKNRNSLWLGAIVLAGILTMMVAIGFLLYALQRSFETILPALLPTIYILVLILGILMLVGINPFARFTSMSVPALKNPFATAYVYGLLLAPMTLPCTGPIIVTAFLLGAGSASQLATELLSFVMFGIGFGWPLVLLPLAAMPLQRRATGWLTKNYTLLTRISGILLVGISVFGFYTEVLPHI